jgi:predicted nucleic acid-binding protein
MRYALDSNIVTYFLKGNVSICGKVIDATDRDNIIVIPPIVFYEIKRWLLTINSAKRITLFEALCSKSGIDIINKDVLEAASVIFSDLQKKGIVIGDNDILIAAYCLCNDLTLITNNEQHFKHIANLKFENWL